MKIEMKKQIDMNQLDISFAMMKRDFSDFTDDEIDEFSNEFIELVEKHNYLVGGGIKRIGDDSWEDDDIDPSGIGGEMSEEDSIAFSEYIRQHKQK